MVARRRAADDGPEVISDDSDEEAELPPITDEVGKKYSSARAPFPAEFREARSKLASFKGKETETAIAGIALAELHLASGGYAQALSLLEKASAMLASLDDYERKAEEQADVLRLLVKAHVEDENPEAALELARGQLEVLEASDERKAEATVRLALCDAYLAMGRSREAIRAAQTALEVFRQLRDKPMVALALRSVASSSLKAGGFARAGRALHAAKEALTVFKRTGNAAEEAAMLLLMSNAHQTRHAPMEAIDFAQRSVVTAQKAGDRRGEAAGLREAAYLFLAGRQELDVALQAAMQAVQLSKDAGDPLGEIASWQVVAGVHRGRGSAQEALEALGMALRLAREIPERRLIKVVLAVIVQTKADVGRVEEALDVMQEEARLAREAGDARRELAAVQKAAALQMELGLHEAAFEAADEAVLLEDPGHRKVQARSLQLLAEVHGGSKRYEEALEVASMAKSLFLGMGSLSEAAEVTDVISDLHISVGNDREALRAREELRDAYLEAGWRDEAAASQLAVAELTLRMDGPQQAVAAAMEAVVMHRGMRDQAGEAAAMLLFARLQAANAAPEEACESFAAARRLFQATGDAEGEAQALLAAAELRNSGTGRLEAASGETVRLLVEAREICRASGAVRWEAKALEALGTLHMAALEEGTKTGRTPDPEALSGALDATRDLSDLLQALGDSAGQVDVLDRLASLRLLDSDPAAALRAAGQAHDLAAELGDPQARGVASLALAEARLAAGEGRPAQEAAEEAAPLLRQAKDKVRLLRAMRVCDAAKEVLTRPGGAVASAPARPKSAAQAKAPASKPPAPSVPVAAAPGKPSHNGPVDFESLAKYIQASIANLQDKQAACKEQPAVRSLGAAPNTRPPAARR